jgi:hypothetical protein
MKSILALFPLLVSCAFGLDIDATTSDGKKVVLQDDGTWRYKDKPIEGLYQVEYEKPTFKANDGYGKEVSVNFEYDLSNKQLKRDVPEEKLKQIVMQAVVKCHNGYAKNPLSYIPRKVFFLRSEEGDFVIQVTWLAKNAYGAEGEAKTLFIYDKNLKLKSEG